MGYLKSTGTVIIYVSLFLAILTFTPGLPPHCEFVEYNITPPKEFTGKLAPNDRLNGAELLHVNEIKGAEYFDSYNGELYTGIHGGYVAKINEKEVKPVVKFGEKCDGVWQEHKCGRPLGLKFDKNGNLYVVDVYYGIYKIKPNGKYDKIIDISKPINGKIPRLPNSLDVTKNGDIYWTVSTTDFPLYDGVYAALANPSGRLIKYSAATKTNEVLLDNLAFANGIKLSDDESFLLLVETFKLRIIKYYIKGAKAGQTEIIAEGLPGIPDNIHTDGQGGFLTSLLDYVDSEHPQIFISLAPHPYIRKMLARLMTLIELPFKLLQDIYPNFYTEKFIYGIGSFEPVLAISERKAVVLRHDVTGKIIDVAYSSDEKLQSISSAFVHNGYLWLGSPTVTYIARVPLKQAFPDLAKIESEKVVKASNTPKVQSTKEQSRTSNVNKAENVKAATSVTEKPAASATVTKKTDTPQATVRSNAPKQATTQPPVTSKPATTTQQSATVSAPKQATTQPPVMSKPATTTQQSATVNAPKQANIQTPVASKPATTTQQSATVSAPKQATTQTPVTSKPATTTQQSATVSAPKQATTQIPVTSKPATITQQSATVKSQTASKDSTTQSSVKITTKSSNEEVKRSIPANEVKKEEHNPGSTVTKENSFKQDSKLKENVQKSQT